MVDVLDRHDPGRGLSLDDFRPPLRDGFPWQHPEEPHLHLNDPDCWWEHVNRLIHAAYEHAG